jgi:transposase
MAPGPSAGVAKRGPSLPRVASPEQSTELPNSKPRARSNAQDRDQRMNANSPPPANSQPHVGIDVAKDKLDLAVDGQHRITSFANDAAGIAELVQQLTKAAPKAAPAVIVIEATGGLERPLLQALLEAELPVALVNPGRVRHFAIGIGILSKTDPIDARVLARFARLAAPRLAEKASKNQIELQALVVCRRQLNVTRAQQTNRLGATAAARARRPIPAVITVLDKQIEKLDRQVRDLIDSDDDFKHLDRLLQSVPGVGPTLSATLTAEMPELGQADGNKIAALAGVAPFNHDSGRFAGKRSIRGGRTSVRCVLYMATIAAIRSNPLIKTFSDRLKNAGKAAKVRIVACMRKLLTLLNAMVRDGLRWDQLDVVKHFAPTP